VVAACAASRIFRRHRRSHLEAALRAASARTGQGTRETERAALEQSIAAVERKQARLVHSLAEGMVEDPEEDRSFRDAIRTEHGALERRRQTLRGQLTNLGSRTTDHVPGDPALLDALPQLDLRVDLQPETLQRQLYESFGLELRYSRPREEIALRVMITRDRLDDLRDAARSLGADNGTRVKPEMPMRDGPDCTHVLGTPDRIRTGATALKGRRPGPLDDGGRRPAWAPWGAVGDGGSIWDGSTDRQRG
jgi:hypothetical protein